MSSYWFMFNEETNKLLHVVSDLESAEEIYHNSDVPLIFIESNNTTDNLETMLAIQNMFQSRLGCEFNTQYIMNHILYAEAEMHEFLRELEGFKAWKKYDWSDEDKAIHLARAKEEFIDILHFICNVALALGLTSNEIMEIYASKYIENHSRQDRGY